MQRSRRRAFRWSVDETGLAEVVFDLPGRVVNTFDTAVLAELDGVLGELERDGRVTVAVFSSAKSKGFAAGADVAELGDIWDVEDARRKIVLGQKVFHRLGQLPFPTLALVHGACLGGGLELALACSRRVAATDAELGFPEVGLGIIPAWGGTQRLVRLIGPSAAVDMICSGRRVNAREALRLGLVDRAARRTELRARALPYARELASQSLPPAEGGEPAMRSEPRRPGAGGGVWRWLLERTPPGRWLLFRRARRAVSGGARWHNPAPLRALRAIEEGMQGSLEAGLALEARLGAGLVVSPAAKNLIHVFGLFESVRRSPWAREAAREQPVERAAVVGGGAAAGVLAQLLAAAGIAVRLRADEPAAVAAALRAARAAFEEELVDPPRAVRSQTGEVDAGMSLISGTTTWHGTGRVDVGLEAIPGDPEVRQRVLRELATRAAPRALLCTTRPSPSLEAVSAGVAGPERVAGFHILAPLDGKRLVEVVRSSATSSETVGRLYRVALRLGLIPVVVRDGPGLLVNRILARYLNEAVHVFVEGVGAEVVDGVLADFGMAVGPLEQLDLTGLDRVAQVGRELHDAFPERFAVPPAFEWLLAAGRTGRSAGRGFYVWAGGTRGAADSSLRRHLAGGTAAAPVPARVDIEHRLVYAMIDEAACCLSDAVVASAAELDTALLVGAGFPAFRGGLLRHADELGARAVVLGLERLAVAHGPRLAPSAALREVAARGAFYVGSGGA